MAISGPDFAGFDRALAVCTMGLSAEARKRAAAALFASLYLPQPYAEELSGIVLWDELAGGSRAIAR